MDRNSVFTTLETSAPRLACASGMIILTLCGVYRTASAQPPLQSNYENSFKRIKAVAARQIRSTNPAERLAGVRKLAKFPTANSAEILLKLGCDSNDDDVRKAAYNALVPLSERSDICDVLARTVRDDLRKRAAGRPTCASLLLLLRSSLPEAALQANRLLALAAEAPPQVRLFLVSVVDELTSQDDEKALSSAIRISKSPVFENTFAVRRSVAQNLIEKGTREAIDNLVIMLGYLRGEVRADVVRYLIGISGKSQGVVPDNWQTWWQAHRDSYRAPTASTAAARSIEIPDGTSSFYFGLPIYAERVVFVIDTSDSMVVPDPGLLDVAKTELVKAILGLSDSARFNVLTFNAAVYTWSPTLVPANAASRFLAAEFVVAQKTAFQTVTYDALEAALNFDADAIIILTDGQPYGGAITKCDEIVKAITRINHLRRVSIHCVSVSSFPGANAFLKALSDNNWGTFRKAIQ